MDVAYKWHFSGAFLECYQGLYLSRKQVIRQLGTVPINWNACLIDTGWFSSRYRQIMVVAYWFS